MATTTSKSTKAGKSTTATKPAKPVKAGSAKPAVKTATGKPAAKAAPGKVAAAKASPAKPVAAKPKPAARPSVTTEQRRFYVEVAAYYMAERRGFKGGNAAEDWIKAEAEIDRLLAEGRINP